MNSETERQRYFKAIEKIILSYLLNEINVDSMKFQAFRILSERIRCETSDLFGRRNCHDEFVHKYVYSSDFRLEIKEEFEKYIQILNKHKRFG